MKSTLGKVLYGSAFCLVAPALLAAWAALLDARSLALPAVHAPFTGATVLVLGAALMARAMWDLWRRGGGLPMNAFPPPRIVTTAAYAWVPHPIYVGFVLFVAGAALFRGSAAGLWIVAPMTALALVTLVIGYERIDLRKRFGATVQPRPWLSLPLASPEAPGFSQRLATALLAFGAWALVYRASAMLGGGRTPLDTMLPFERQWPVWEWTAIFYLGAYLWIALAPFVARARADLREFGVSALWGTAVIGWCFLAFPLVALPRALDLSTFAGAALQLDRDYDTVACAFPSFHVFWAFAAARVWAGRVNRVASGLIALAITLSCLTTGAHSLLDVIAGGLVYGLVARRFAVWDVLRVAAERIANGWRDWRVGSVRIINHGAYVGLAAAAGVALAILLLGPSWTGRVVFVALCALVGAGAWGQWLEASSQLSRPFGYFGGLFGGAIGVVLVHLWDGTGWHLAAAYAVAATVIQATGRLRCLTQGCCHGRPIEEARWGIRYRQPLSRVCKLARLDGVPLHPTPLYSIIANIVIFGLLLRLWHERAETGLIVGSYLLLSTCARFMEEGYRGEPQTARFAGLPIYQWLALGCFLAGIALTSLATPRVPEMVAFDYRAILAGLPVGVLVWFAMGVDFPESSRHMSRLA
jgi:prolipoprotein diacylglyceryltransferase/protein-S-isoprenylcysteine O-methyltransferase Ste14